MANSYYDNASYGVAFLSDVEKPRNLFSQPYTISMDFSTDYLYPLEVYCVNPGDTLNLKSLSAFIRMNPTVAPTMDMLYYEQFAFFVPLRQVWANTKKFFGEQASPDDSTEYVVPYLTGIPATGFAVNSIFDYAGLPPEIPVNSNIHIISTPFRAMNKIYNRWFRNENLQDSLPDLMGDGPDNVSNFSLFKRCKRKDYITTCLPWTQKGPSVSITIPDFSSPVTGSAYGDGKTLGLTNGAGQMACPVAMNPPQDFLGGYINYTPKRNTTKSAGTDFSGTMGVSQNATKSGLIVSATSVSSNVPVMSINEFRAAIQTQGFNEINAMYGTRFPEFIYGHFGVRSSDYRIQDPELLAISSTPLNFSVIPQTSSTDATTPQGNLTAYGVFEDDSLHFSKSFEEWGYVIIFANIRANISYTQRLDRKWTVESPLDYMYPDFANLGFQEVYKYEVCMTGAASDLEVFGYNERYAHERYKLAGIRGKLRPYVKQSLGVWNLSEVLDGSTIALNNAFIQSNTPINRIMAVQNENPFIGHFTFDLDLISTLPFRGTPATLSRI